MQTLFRRHRHPFATLLLSPPAHLSSSFPHPPFPTHTPQTYSYFFFSPFPRTPSTILRTPRARASFTTAGTIHDAPMGHLHLSLPSSAVAPCAARHRRWAVSSKKVRSVPHAPMSTGVSGSGDKKTPSDVRRKGRGCYWSLHACRGGSALVRVCVPVCLVLVSLPICICCVWREG